MSEPITSNLDITTNIQGTQALETQGQLISFYSEGTGKSVYFNAFIMAFNETYNSDWASEKVFGRTDPIKLFKDTERRVTLSFKIPAASRQEALQNLRKLQALIQFLYPRYHTQVSDSTGRAYANNISSSPLVRLRVVNFLSKVTGMNVATDTNAKNGLLGTISNFTVGYNFEGETAVIEDLTEGVLPTAIDINLEFSVLHEKTLGWDAQDNFIGGANFPYNITEAAANTVLSPNPVVAGNPAAAPPPPADGAPGEGLDGDGASDGAEPPTGPGTPGEDSEAKKASDAAFLAATALIRADVVAQVAAISAGQAAALRIYGANPIQIDPVTGHVIWPPSSE
jgi:hypothetical protein